MGECKVRGRTLGFQTGSGTRSHSLKLEKAFGPLEPGEGSSSLQETKGSPTALLWESSATEGSFGTLNVLQKGMQAAFVN